MSDPIKDSNGQPASGSPLPPAACSAEWAPILVSAIIATCRQQIGTLKMKMPINVALAIGRADEELADAEAWIRAEQPNQADQSRQKEST